MKIVIRGGAVLFGTVVVLFVLTSVLYSAQSASTAVPYFDLAVDETRGLLYGSVDGGTSIDVVSMNTLQVIQTIPVGSYPSGLDISPDGRELAVALHQGGRIVLIDLDTLTVTAFLTPTVTTGPNQPYDVLYGRPGRLYSVGNPGSSGFDFVHVFDTITHTEVGASSFIVRAAPRLAMTADKNTLYVSEPGFSPQQVYRFDITTDTPIMNAQGPHGPVYVRTLAVSPTGDKVYTSYGQVWTGDMSTMTVTLPASGMEIEYISATQRLAISTANGVTLLDANDYAVVRQFDVSGGAGVARATADGEKLYVSTTAGVRAMPLIIRGQTFLPAAMNSFCGDFFDDFSNPASGWSIGDDNLVRAEYLDGEFRVLSKNRDYLYLFDAPSCRRPDYRVEVDARWSGQSGDGYGIAFGIEESFARYYLFYVSADYGEFALYRRDANGFVRLTGFQQSPAINTGQATNHLEVIRSGPSIYLYANNSFLTSWWDDTISGATQAGVFTNPYYNSDVSDARFDNFMMQTYRVGDRVEAIPTAAPALVDNATQSHRLNKSDWWLTKTSLQELHH